MCEIQMKEHAGMAMVLEEKVEKGPVVILKNVSFIENKNYGVERLLPFVYFLCVLYLK